MVSSVPKLNQYSTKHSQPTERKARFKIVDVIFTETSGIYTIYVHDREEENLLYYETWFKPSLADINQQIKNFQLYIENDLRIVSKLWPTNALYKKYT